MGKFQTIWKFFSKIQKGNKEIQIILIIFSAWEQHSIQKGSRNLLTISSLLRPRSLCQDLTVLRVGSSTAIGFPDWGCFCEVWIFFHSVFGYPNYIMIPKQKQYVQILSHRLHKCEEQREADVQF